MVGKTGIKIKTPDGRILNRIPKIIQCGNFQQLVVRFENKEYLVGDGDEYLRGPQAVYELGKCLTE